MRRRRILVGVMFTMIALVAFASGAAVVVASKGARLSPADDLTVNCRSPSLGGNLPAEVYLPAGYANGSNRYPVIYFLHGLPAGPQAYTTNPFVAAALATNAQPAIVVAPQGSRTANGDREYLDWGPTEDWPAAIAHDLPRCIDQRFRTVKSRTGRALVGLSAGGYGAFNIGLRNLATFGAVESWSGYFIATDPTGEHVLELGSPEADSAALVPNGPSLKTALTTWPTLIAFYVGNADSRFLTMNQQFDATLHESAIPHVFRIYTGAHSGTLWRAQAPTWLGMALSNLAREAGHRK